MYQLCVSLYIPTKMRKVVVKIPALPIHELSHMLWLSPRFDMCVLGEFQPEALAEFWAKLTEREQ
eukprot:2057850-Prorocentrum_lima.AAC.1